MFGRLVYILPVTSTKITSGVFTYSRMQLQQAKVLYLNISRNEFQLEEGNTQKKKEENTERELENNNSRLVGNFSRNHPIIT